MRDILEIVREVEELVSEHQWLTDKAGKLKKEIESFNYTESYKEALEENFGVYFNNLIEDLDQIIW